MVSKLIYAILKLIVKVASILLLPLEAIVTGTFPDFSSALVKLTEYMSLPFSVMGWVFELVHIPSICISLIVGAFVYKYAILGTVRTVKYAITLYQRFKP